MGDWADGVTTNPLSRSATTANVKKMLLILDQAAKPNQAKEVGFDEGRIIELYRLWLIVGSWMHTPDYAKQYGVALQNPRALKRPTGVKQSDLLRSALKRLAEVDRDNDSKHRRDAFDYAELCMSDFMFAFRTVLKQDPIRAKALDQKLQPIPDDVKINYQKSK
jgi:hypothetical protein